MKKFNEIIVKNILSKIPANVRLADYLADILSIGKEPAYRRIRGNVPFTFEEVAIIAQTLGLSVDSMLEQTNENKVVQFTLPVDMENGTNELIINMFTEELKRLEMLSKVNNLQVMMGVNRIIWHYFNFPLLFRFDYCRYMYAFNQLPLSASFSEITVPEEILDLYRKIRYYAQKLPNITCIIDNRVIDKTIEGILYFRTYRLISDEEVKALQQELNDFLDYIVQKNIQPQADERYQWKFYLCANNVDTNALYCSYDDEEFAQFWIFFESPFIIRNNALISKIQQRWLESHKKTSQLITQSNDLVLNNYYHECKQKIAAMI